MTKKVKIFLIAAALSTVFSAIAHAGLAAQIDAVIRRQSQKKTQFSIQITKADSGKNIYRRNAANPMIPASNMKLVTTAAALKFLGPNYQYKTQIGLCGNTLVVVASGDPLLGDKITDAGYSRRSGWIFDDIIAKLKKYNRTTINDIVIDTSIFDDQRVHPNWPPAQLNRWFACEVSGLNYNLNCIDMTTRNINGRIKVSIEPATGYVELVNKVKSVSKGKTGVGAYRTPTPNKLIVKGRCKKQQGPFDVAIERPAAFFGFMLYENLAAAGIDVHGQLKEQQIDPACDFNKLAEYTTAISDCIVRCNKDSLGLAAEALLKTIAANSKPDKKNGSWQTGQKLISDYLRQLGIDRSQFEIDDGSGLSRDNRLSANAITKVLMHIYKSKNAQLYKDSLAVGGIDGTMSRRFRDKKYKGKVFAKTGYIAGVRSLSGICSTANGDYIFSILTNKSNYKTRRAIDDIVKAIIDNG